ncbi:DNA helicase RecQ [Clostridium rectalis]|uniref:DNA helicase RecQ n=1 Tax=Clostridium rectalis TaxID=2040295 RepID=UPI000F64405A|nr:DNA helicase RecQ [Clostridium rectalis]
MLQNAKKILKKYFGYDEFRKSQEKVIQSILNKEDTVAIMPTGAGKSICYQVPAILLKGVTIVVSPLISLMKDQVDSLKELGVEATYINSSLNDLEIQERLFNAESGQYTLIYVAPERLESKDFCNSLNSIHISLVAVDEAHCVSQWGHDFRPSYRRVKEFIERLDKRPIVGAFTATATEVVQKDILKLLALNNPNVFLTGFDRPNLSFEVIKGENKENFIYDFLENNKGNTGIIYTSTRKEAQTLYNKISSKGYKASVYHAGLNDKERKKAQEDFSFDNIHIMIATNAFGMGIDKSNVRFVIHYNIPKNMEAYYQEAGRAGRDGEESQCILLFSPKDIQIQKYFIDASLMSPDRKNYEYNKLRAMVDYCYTSKCLRAYILEYFGEKNVLKNCNNCSNCKDDREEKDITLEAQKILSCVYRMQGRFGVTMVADVLKGSKNKKVLNSGLNEVSTYGIMKEFPQKNIVALINKLIADEYLATTDDKYPVVKLTSKSYQVLRGIESVFMKVSKVKKVNKPDNTLFNILKELRKEISSTENVPPFMIFHDSTLKELSEVMPTNVDDFILIKGIGERKSKVYGKLFVETIKDYVKDNNIQIDRFKTENLGKEEKTKTHIVTYNLYITGNNLGTIAKERGLAVSTVKEHLLKCLMEGMEVNTDNFIDHTWKKLIWEAIEKIGGNRLKPIKEALPAEIDYATIKFVWYKYNSEKINEKTS